MSISRPAIVVLAIMLSACDQIAVLDGSKAREADGVAVGSACRQAGRTIEDCFTMNPDSPKANVFAGWKEMNDYMVQNKLDTVAPQIARAAVKPKAEAEKPEAKAEAGEKQEAKPEAGEKREVKPAAAEAVKLPVAEAVKDTRDTKDAKDAKPAKEAVKTSGREEPKESAAEAGKDPGKDRAREAAREIMREVNREKAFKEPVKPAPAPEVAAAPTQGATLVLPSTPPAAAQTTGPIVAPPLPTVVKPIPQSH